MAQGKNGKSENKSGKRERKRERQGEETEQKTRKWNANKMWKPNPNSYPRKSNLKLTVDGWHLFAACLVSIFHLLAQSICLLIFLLVFDLPCRLLIFDWIPREYSLDSRAVAHKPWLHLATVLSPSPSLSLANARQTKTELMKISYSHSIAWQILFPPPPLLWFLSLCVVYYFFRVPAYVSVTLTGNFRFHFYSIFSDSNFMPHTFSGSRSFSLSISLSLCLLYLRFYLWAS